MLQINDSIEKEDENFRELMTGFSILANQFIKEPGPKFLGSMIDPISIPESTFEAIQELGQEIIKGVEG